MLQQDFYEVLGVSHNASYDEIRRAYHRLVLRYHPDTNPNDPDTVEHFRRVVQAYEQLRNPFSRTQYNKIQTTSAEWEYGSWGQAARRSSFSIKPFLFAALVAVMILCAGIAFCRSISMLSVPLEWQEWQPKTTQVAQSSLFDPHVIDISDRLNVEFWTRELEICPSNLFAAHNLAVAYERIARSARNQGDHVMARQFQQAAMQIRPLGLARRSTNQAIGKS